MATFPNQPIFTIDPAFAEMISERLQDMDRSGYQNFGSDADFFVSNPSTTTNRLINAQGGDDFIALFGQGDDIVYGGSGSDTLITDGGDDKLYGGSGADTLEAGFGNDQLSGGSGADELWGGAGADFMQGGSGNDKVMGDHDGSATSQQGNDTLDGGIGNDTLSGGGGADRLLGGSGADVFQFETHLDLGLGHTDVILDFSRTEGDKIDLNRIDANLNVSGNQGFVLATSTAERALAGRFWLGDAVDGQQTVFMNLDGGAADISLIVKFDDPSMTTLQITDFFV